MDRNCRDEGQIAAVLTKRSFAIMHARPAARTLFLSAAAWLAATVAGACVAQGPCAETATCPVGTDARSEPETGSADDGGAPDGDAADVSHVDDRTDGANRSDAADVADISREGDGSTPDGPTADRASDGRVDGDTGNTSDGAADASAPECNLDAGRSPTDNPCIVNERYGIFVSPTGSDATGAGTRGAPFRTLNRGLHAAKTETMRVFVCDNGSEYADPITIDATLDGLAVYGGFDCAGWTLVANARIRVRPPAGPALTISGLTIGVTFENFELQAMDAAIGASSIAVRVEGSQRVVFRRTRIAAGKGGAGANGIHGQKGSDGDPPGPEHRGRSALCPSSITSQAGGLPSSSTCGSKRGEGGASDSLLAIGAPGQPGLPMLGVDPPDQQNEGTMCIEDCHGKRGSDGVAGVPGSANPQGGTISSTSYTPGPAGGGGTPGHVAQGGGGGAGTVTDYSTTQCVGASGGAGGLGGCGGGAGTGGGAGGASIGLLSWASGITLDGCALESVDGGGGGSGGNGSVGGIGGQGAIGGVGYDGATFQILASGDGGWGGHGGPGGAGAGGNGGPSYTIAHAGGRPLQIGGTTVVRGTGGAKGIGGLGPIVGFPDGGAPEGGAGTPDGGNLRAPDGFPGAAAAELVLP
ncbi:MAG TPA: hypothetical protein VK540_02240 [Polyangiaceae bacterium]|nr:hypothetical protein [Polyangiaceae bacterium]